MKPLALSLIFVIGTALFGCAGGRGGELSAPGAGTDFKDPPPPEFVDAFVHDPSVFPDKAENPDSYYIIGSHLAAAKTADFIAWEQVTSDWRGRKNKFYPLDNGDPAVQTMDAQIADVMRGSKDPLSFFAADIHAMPNGEFYYYYCLTSSWYCSAIGLAVSENGPEGPYVTRGLFVRSGEAADGSLSPDGTARWSQDTSPNCIDPQAFFDRDGRFWLVYGSWSGGIFLYEMDAASGFPLSGSALNAEHQGYGRRLIRNNHTAIEAPYIIWCPETSYYYLFVSFGGLTSNGGYNIRVFRSKNPDGPYEDALAAAAGDDPGHADAGASLSTLAAEDYGVKIMGGYQFMPLPGEAAQSATGYVSPGHNSVWRDAKTGRYFMIYHQRFYQRSEGHKIRVSELFPAGDGWLAASPFRYAGNTQPVFSAKELSGTWKIINHGRRNNTAPEQSRRYQFLKNGAIRNADGAKAGTWKLEAGEAGMATITLDGVEYKGRFLRCWDGDNKAWVQAFTALSADGIALWGAGMAGSHHQ